jgi:hypothetical protein
MVSVSLGGKGQGEEGYNKESVVDRSVYYKVRVAGEVTIDLGTVQGAPDGGPNQVRYSNTGSRRA